MVQSPDTQSRLSRAIVRLVYAQRRRVVGKAARTALWLLGVDIPAAVKIGPGLKLGHPTAGVVIHPSVQLGKNVTIFHGATLGRADPWNPMPEHSGVGIIVGDGALVAAGAVVMFTPGNPVRIGEGAIIGANAVVTRSVGAGETWVGNPARRVGGPTQQ